MERTLEQCRWVYNQTLAYRKDAWEKEGRSANWYETKRLLPQWKTDRPALKNVHSQVLQNVTERVDLAFKAFFRRARQGEKELGYPRFRGQGRYDSFTYTQSGFKLNGNRLTLSKLGAVKVVLHRSVEGQIKTCCIRRSATSKWFVTLTCEIEPEHLPENTAQVGIDVGLHVFAALSTDETIDNPRFFRKDERSLAKAQRRMAKETKGTPERTKRRKVVCRIHERIANRRNDFAHQHSRWIVNRFGLIAVEDINTNRMVHNHCLAKSIMDAAWSSFLFDLTYKAEDAGRVIVKVNPAYTSQQCSSCDHRQPTPLSKRVYRCPCCGLEIDRDLNASLNILAVGLHGVRNQSVKAQPA
jgi:putative transposase